MTSDELNQLHHDLCDDARALMAAKNHDYSSGVDPFHNFRMAKMLGIPTELGVLMRMCDKIARLKTFSEKGVLKVENESYRDAILDIINYAVLFAGIVQADQPQRSADG